MRNGNACHAFITSQLDINISRFSSPRLRKAHIQVQLLLPRSRTPANLNVKNGSYPTYSTNR